MARQHAQVMVKSFHAALGYGRETLGRFDFMHTRATRSKPPVSDAFRTAYVDPYDQPIYDRGRALYHAKFRIT